MVDLQAFSNFSSAASAVLSFLQERTGFDLWMVTRKEADDWIVLDAQDKSYGIKAGKVFRWTDSLCSRMVEGEGPQFAPNIDAVNAYADAPITNQIAIGAFIGVPLARADGTLFGTLCGMHPKPASADLERELPTVKLLAQLLSNLLISELATQDQTRRAERAEADLLTDSLTGLFNRRGWDSLLASEESRCKRYGNPACVLSVDLDDLKVVNDTQGHARGDELLKTAAEILRTSKRQQDIAARIGGDEFALLAIECDTAGGDALVARLLEAFTQAGVRASIGMSPRLAAGTLDDAWLESDRLMYSHKKRTEKVSPT
jgi:diguanylate cyclase